MIIVHFITKLQGILSTVWGWLSLAVLFVIDCISGHGMAVGIALIAIVMDAAWGISASIKQGKFAKSQLARDTIGKIAVYGCAILSFSCIDKLLGIHSGLTTNIICSLIVLVEFWSTLGSMLICFPHIPFLRVIKFALIGEIANKLGIGEDEVKNALEELDNKKKL
jgi:hypothetical protein